MLLLIIKCLLDVFKNLCFNTSHVTINHFCLSLLLSFLDGFNTSHVTINQLSCYKSAASLGVSIHLMLLLIRAAGGSKSRCIEVSIHLMLLLIIIPLIAPIVIFVVSIHLMLLLIAKEYLRTKWGI